jgi:hypothetical protein
MGSTGYQKVDSGSNIAIERTRKTKGKIADRYFNDLIGFLLFLASVATSLLHVDGIIDTKIPMVACWAALYSFYFIRIIVFYVFTRKERPYDA